MYNYSKDSEIKRLLERLSNYKGKLIKSDYEEYITDVRENKRRREEVFPKKEKRKGLEQVDIEGLDSNCSISRVARKKTFNNRNSSREEFSTLLNDI